MINATNFVQVCIVILFLLPVAAIAETCEVVSKKGGFMIIDCNGERYNAMTKEIFSAMRTENNKLKEDNKKLVEQLKNTQSVAVDFEALVTKYDTLNKNYEKLNEKYQGTLDSSINLNESYQEKASKLVELNEKFDKLVTDYDDLTGKYRDIALSGGSPIRFDLGIGLTEYSDSSEMAYLVGASIYKLNVWGFLQDDNNGLLVGTSIRF